MVKQAIYFGHWPVPYVVALLSYRVNLNTGVIFNTNFIKKNIYVLKFYIYKVQEFEGLKSGNYAK